MWLQNALRRFLGIHDLTEALVNHHKTMQQALAEREGVLQEALARIEARLTNAHIDLSKQRREVPLLDYDTLQAIAAKELDGPPPKDSPFAEM